LQQDGKPLPSSAHNAGAACNNRSYFQIRESGLLVITIEEKFPHHSSTDSATDGSNNVDPQILELAVENAWAKRLGRIHGSASEGNANHHEASHGQAGSCKIN
jgi:hypothetical protein